MSEDPIMASKHVMKTSASLDTIPQDIHLTIAQLIRTWDTPEGTEEEIEKGRR